MSIPQHQMTVGSIWHERAQNDASKIGQGTTHPQTSMDEADAQISAYISGSDGQGKDLAGIRCRTLKCQDLFESCQKDSHLSGDDWIDKMAADFNWWSLGIGAAKAGHSSLDYRVQTRDDVRKALVNLLDSLTESLEKYLYEAPQFGHPSQSTIAQAREQDQEGAMTYGSNSKAPDNGSMLDEQKYYIETTIQFLSRISMAIRKSGTKFRHQRVDKLLMAREPELKKFRDYLRFFVLMSPTKAHTLHTVLQQHFLTSDPTWKILWTILKAYFTDIQRLTPVQDRLIQANVVRRNRFDLYFARYRQKTRSQKAPQLLHIQAAAAATLLPKDDRPAPAPSRSNVSETSSNQRGKAALRPVEDSQRSSQSATKMGSFVMPQGPREQKARSVSTMLSQGVLKQDYPKCPGAEGESFWCPYCAQLLDSSYSDPKNKRWRGHVVEDLTPYVCVYDDCDSPDAMYVTTLEWKKHIKDSHSRAQWICDPCWLDSGNPEEFEFDSLEEWQKHTLTEHEDEVDESDLPDLAELSQRTGVPPVACPLCHDDASLRNPETDKHLAEHIHSFALQSLPWDLIGPDDETQVSFGSNIEKPGSSAGSAASTTETHPKNENEVASFESVLRTVKNRTLFLLREGRYPDESGVPAFLVTIESYLDGPSSRFSDYHPSFKPEILACLLRLDNILQRDAYQSSDFKEQDSVGTFEQDIAEGFKSFQHLLSLSELEFLKPSYVDEMQSPSNMEVPEGLMPNKARDPENWDIDSSDGTHVDVPTVVRVLPYERNSGFIARPELSDKLFDMLPTSSNEFQSAAIWGAPGSGKTQLALEYAYARSDDSNCSVFWVRADSAAVFTTDYHLIAKALKIEQHLKGDRLLAAVRSGIEAHQPWVLILDGADELSLFNGNEDLEYFTSLFDFIPKGPRGTVLWTSCDVSIAWSVSGPLSCLDITSMRYTEAERLFLSTRGQITKHRKTAYMRDDMAHVLRELHHLPLAIVQAGAYMRHTSTSIHDYLTLLGESKKRLAAVSKWSPGVVISTSAISLDWIHQRNRIAIEMVHVVAYLDSRNIALDLLTNTGGYTEELTIDEHFHRQSTATRHLTALRLIASMGGGSRGFEMHPLVQKAVRLYQDATERNLKFIYAAKALSLVTKCFFFVNHVVRVCDWAEMCTKEIEAVSLMDRVSRLLDDEERWLEKESVDKRVLEIRKEVSGEWHPDTISSSMSLAATYYQQGRYGEALTLANGALKLREHLFGQANIYTIRSRMAIGMIYYQMFQLGEAETIYKEVLQQAGLETPERALVFACLAQTYYRLGQYTAAELNFEASVALHQSLDDWDHPDALQALHEYAIVLHRNGRRHKATETMQKCVELRRAVLGLAHPLTNVSTLLLENWKAGEE